MKIVVVVSANAEWRVVKEIIPDLALEKSSFSEFADLKMDARHITLFHGGWGKISAAATAQYVIDHFQPDLLINLGTCGGFDGRIETGKIILAEKTIVYDIIEQMGDGAEAIKSYSTELDLSWLKHRSSSVVNGLLVSADRDIVVEDIPMLIQKYNAVAADWESGAIAWVAKRNGVRCLILRGVTDLVGGSGGEAYGNLELFHQRTKSVMKNLFDLLPDFLRGL
jgi:adenosylhomocysteine nucleosidase